MLNGRSKRVEIEPLDPAARPAAVRTLVRAFFDDPLFAWVEPDPSRRPETLAYYMGGGAEYGRLFGETWVAPDASAVAVWLRPGDTEVDPDRLEQAGLVNQPHVVSAEGLERFSRFIELGAEWHVSAMSDPHWYLMILGVEPAQQGQGVGGAMLRPMLARADADGLPCYLETAKARNLAFYARHGFAVVREGAVPGGGPWLWAMQRAPRTPGSA